MVSIIGVSVLLCYITYVFSNTSLHFKIAFVSYFIFTEKLKSCSFKPTMTQELGRTYRNEVTLKIRKDKNDDRLKKKRMEHTNMTVLNSSMLQY